MNKFYCKSVSSRSGSDWLMIAVFLFFLCIGLFFLSGALGGKAIGDEAPGGGLLSGEQKFGLLIVLFTGAAIGLILKATSASGYYGIDETGIRCKVGPLNDRISFQEIESIEALSNDQARALALDFDEKEDRDEKDPAGDTYSMDELICYSIVPFTIVHTKHTRSAASPSKTDIKAKGDFLLMTLKNGKKFILSPDDREAFLEEYNRMKW